MASPFQRACSTPGCPKTAAGPRCADCAAQHQAARDARERAYEASRPTFWRRGYNAEYEKARRIVMRGSPACALCGVAQATQCDHIVSLADGGTNEVRNLRPVCRPCHVKRTDWSKRARRKAHA